VGGGFSNGCFLAAARELMQRLAKGKTQKHQNRLMPLAVLCPKKVYILTLGLFSTSYLNRSFLQHFRLS